MPHTLLRTHSLFPAALGLVLSGLLAGPCAQAQSGAGLSAATPGAAGATAAASSRWVTVHRAGAGAVQVDADSVVTRQDMRIYRLRDTSPSTVADGPGWAAARCASGERADVHNPRVMRSAFDPQQVDAAQQTWHRPLPQSAAAGELEYICAASAGSQAVPNAPAAWSDEERRALVAAWLHTAGERGFEYRVATFGSQKQARAGRVTKWAAMGRFGALDTRTLHAASLVDVPLALRVPLLNLFTPGERSPVLPTQDATGAPQWRFIELVATSKARDPRDAQDFERQAQRWLAQGLLPEPAALRADASHQARAAYWAVRQASDLAAVPATLSPSVRFGNLQTPLLRALLLANVELAQALLARGADANACGPIGCPLHLAHYEPQADTRARLLDMLLNAGAKPDQFDPRFSGADATVLQAAAFKGDRPVMERLLQAGASPDGAPGVRVTPLESALAAGRRDVAELLLNRGAAVLPPFDRSQGEIFRGNAWMAASEHPPLQAWMAQAMLAAAQTDPRWHYEAHLEQDGRRLPLADGAQHTLRAAPFKLVVRLPADGSLTLASSFSPQFAAEVKAGERLNGMLRTLMSSALAPVPEPDSYELYAYESRPAAAKPGTPWGGSMVLSSDASLRGDFHEVRAASREYVREVRAVYSVKEEKAATPQAQPMAESIAEPIAALKGRPLHLVLGTSLVLDPYEWAPLVHPRAVTLHFR